MNICIRVCSYTFRKVGLGCLVLFLLMGVWQCDGSNVPKEASPEKRSESLQDSGEPVQDSGAPVEKTPEQPTNQPRCTTLFEWPVPKKPIPIQPSNNWKHSIKAHFSNFAVSKENSAYQWVKFTILLADPTKVYFQNSHTFPFHYDFATKELGPFKGMKRADYDAISLHKKGQRVVLGAVIIHKNPAVKEYGVVFERHDPMHPELTEFLFKQVTRSVQGDKEYRAFYFPSFHQREHAEHLKDCLAQKGVPLSSIQRWVSRDECYSNGWTLGTLKFFTGKDIDKAYTDGRLKPTDILLTDHIPSEIPHVAGVLTLQPATPNSHVVILANTFQIPLAYVHDETQAKNLLNQEILLRVSQSYRGCSVHAFEPKLTSSEKQELLKQKKPVRVEFQEKKTLGKISISTQERTPSDAAFIGGKAAHFGLLREALPDHSPVSIAFSFDLWDAFMQQKLQSGKTLSEEIHQHIQSFTYPPNMSKLETALAHVRDLIRKQGRFSDGQKKKIVEALGVFDARRKIRFRSSTNVEDSKVFTGAGLYGSYSGCLADDQDQDDKGPSLCDSSKSKERGLFRAIRKVYASFYNRNAFLERLRFGIDERKVGMALVVHHSFPDPDEWANGVATVTVQSSGRGTIQLVTQKGAVSITNPDSKARPEVVEANWYSSMGQFFIRQKSSSNLVPLGRYVMQHPEDYKKLLGLIQKVYALGQSKGWFKAPYTLDLEYKKMKPGKFVIKQVRQIPVLTSKDKVTPFLVRQPHSLCVFQGEFSDVFAIHRLKSRWKIQTKTLVLDQQGLRKNLLSTSRLEYLSGGKPVVLEGDPAKWSQAKHTTKERSGEMVHLNAFESIEPRRTLTLEMILPKSRERAHTPILTSHDLSFYMKAQYAKEVAFVARGSKIQMRKEEHVRLSTMCPEYTKHSQQLGLQKHTFTLPQNTKIETQYYWPPGPTGTVAGYTAPLVKWKQTTIVGLTPKPILLTSTWAQTYRPEHHNFDASFIFDPWLDPGVSKEQRDALKAKDIRWIYLFVQEIKFNEKVRAWVMDFKGQLREWK